MIISNQLRCILITPGVNCNFLICLAASGSCLRKAWWLAGQIGNSNMTQRTMIWNINEIYCSFYLPQTSIWASGFKMLKCWHKKHRPQLFVINDPWLPNKNICWLILAIIIIVRIHSRPACVCWMYGEVRRRGETELNALRCRHVSGRSLETNDRNRGRALRACK